MAGNVSMGFLGTQDLIYGFSLKKVAERLTSENGGGRRSCGWTGTACSPSVNRSRRRKTGRAWCTSCRYSAQKWKVIGAQSGGTSMTSKTRSVTPTEKIVPL
jgi:hypothetical protein